MHCCGGLLQSPLRFSRVGWKGAFLRSPKCKGGAPRPGEALVWGSCRPAGTAGTGVGLGQSLLPRSSGSCSGLGYKFLLPENLPVHLHAWTRGVRNCGPQAPSSPNSRSCF